MTRATMTEDGLDELIDEMLAQGPAARDANAWKQILHAGNSGERWLARVGKRKAAITQARLVAHRGWLARLLLGLRRGRRRLGAVARTPARATAAPSLLGATLGPTAGDEATGVVELPWGEHRVRPTRVGETVRVEVSGPATVAYVTDEAQGMLPTKAWKLEEGEAPVALVVMASGTRALSTEVADLVERASAAVLVLVEDEGGSDANEET